MPSTMCSCPIWNTTANYSRKGIVYEYYSIRAGGAYTITEEDKKWISNIMQFGYFGNITKAKLTTWIIGRHNQGEKSPKVTKDIVGYVSRKSPLPIETRIDNLLKYIYLNEQERLANDNENALGLSLDELLAQSETINETHWCQIFKYMEEQKYIEGKIFDKTDYQLRLCVNGLKRIEEFNKHETNRVFVAMWFDGSMDNVYENAIKPAIEEMGYEPIRIDKKEHNNKIDDEIIAEIKRSKFLVADFSQGEDGARGGVYYEAGFAHGLNIEVIFTCRGSDEGEIHFDTRQFNHIFWKDADDLKKRLKDRIGALIGESKK